MDQSTSDLVKSKSGNMWKTIALSFCFLADGMNNAIVGPTLLDLQTQTGSHLKEISLILPFRSIGQGVGALAGKIEFVY